jgi:phosphoribosylglycinamide formyltransferase 1
MNIGVLASHEGTTLQSLIDGCASGRIPGRVVLVVSNNSTSGALAKARLAGVRALHLSSSTHERPEALDAAMRDALMQVGAELVFLAGYMKRVGPLVLAAFNGRVLNTHPALLPRFGGKGMYGDHVFRAVLDAGEAESGVSVHLVDPDYDTGPVVSQRKLQVLPDDSLETLKARIRSIERELVVETLAQIAHGRIALVGRAG